MKSGSNYLIASQTAGTYISANASAVKHNSFSLEVDAPASFGAMMRMAEFKANPWSTVANHTKSRHINLQDRAKVNDYLSRNSFIRQVLNFINTDFLLAAGSNQCTPNDNQG
jgi:hypothetical protein